MLQRPLRTRETRSRYSLAESGKKVASWTTETPPALAYSEGQMLSRVLLLEIAIGGVNNKRQGD